MDTKNKYLLVSPNHLNEMYKNIVDLPLALEPYIVFNLVIETICRILLNERKDINKLQFDEFRDLFDYIQTIKKPTDIPNLNDILTKLHEEKKKFFLPIGNIYDRAFMPFKRDVIKKFLEKYNSNLSHYYPDDNEKLLKKYKEYEGWRDNELIENQFFMTARVYIIDCLGGTPDQVSSGTSDFDKILRVFVVDVLKLNKSITIGKLYKNFDK